MTCPECGKEIDFLHSRLAISEAARERAEKALRALFGGVESGQLVPSVSSDHEPGWALGQVPRALGHSPRPAPSSILPDGRRSREHLLTARALGPCARARLVRRLWRGATCWEQACVSQPEHRPRHGHRHEPGLKGMERSRRSRGGEGDGGARAPRAGPLALAVVFYRPRPQGHFGSGRNSGRLRDSEPGYPTTKPDTTKLLRGVEDALTGILWRDDSLVCVQQAEKRYGEPARIEVEAREIGG